VLGPGRQFPLGSPASPLFVCYEMTAATDARFSVPNAAVSIRRKEEEAVCKINPFKMPPRLEDRAMPGGVNTGVTRNRNTSKSKIV